MTKPFNKAAQVAKIIKAELKQAFPTYGFSVTSFSPPSAGYEVSVEIHPNDIMIEDEVEAMVAKYETGKYDRADGVYKYTNVRDDIPQVRAVVIHQLRNAAQAWKEVEDITELMTSLGIEIEEDSKAWIEHEKAIRAFG